jgi:hypothetical protein
VSACASHRGHGGGVLVTVCGTDYSKSKPYRSLDEQHLVVSSEGTQKQEPMQSRSQKKFLYMYLIHNKKFGLYHYYGNKSKASTVHHEASFALVVYAITIFSSYR